MALNDIENIESMSDDELADHDLNKCDKCGEIVPSDDLIWITAEDFESFPDELVPQELYKKYNALCETCYYSEIRCKKHRRYKGLRIPTADCNLCRRIYSAKKIKG